MLSYLSQSLKPVQLLHRVPLIHSLLSRLYKVINRHDTWITLTSFINGTILVSFSRSITIYLLYTNLVSGYQLRPTYNHSDLDQSLPVYHLLQKMTKDNYHHGTCPLIPSLPMPMPSSKNKRLHSSHHSL